MKYYHLFIEGGIPHEREERLPTLQDFLNNVELRSLYQVREKNLYRSQKTTQITNNNLQSINFPPTVSLLSCNSLIPMLF